MFDAELSAEDNLLAISERFAMDSQKIYDAVKAMGELRPDIKDTMTQSLEAHRQDVLSLINQISQTW